MSENMGKVRPILRYLDSESAKQCDFGHAWSPAASSRLHMAGCCHTTVSLVLVGPPAWGAGVQVEALRVLQRATVQLGLLSGPTTPTHRRSAWLDAATVVVAPAQGWSPASHVVPTMSGGEVHWWDNALPAGWLPLHVR
jgi:hypothetical protein